MTTEMTIDSRQMTTYNLSHGLTTEGNSHALK